MGSQESGVLLVARVVQCPMLLVAPVRSQYSSADLLYLTLKTMISTWGWGQNFLLCHQPDPVLICCFPTYVCELNKLDSVIQTQEDWP